jgi:hypothetical protein
MSERVAVLLVRDLPKAMLQRSIAAADTEPYWLSPEQYKERDGGVEFLPAMAGDMLAYAKRNHLRPLGIVVVKESGEYSDFFNDELIISPIDRDFLKELFQIHAHFWFCYVPWLAANQKEA